MRKLLSANFSRLWKDKIFWIGTLFMFGLGLFAVCMKYSSMIRYESHEFLDDALFSYTAFIGICAAVFCSMFMGTEYSDGTIRNKLIIGHLRSSIYWSNWLTDIVAVLIMAAAFLLSYCTLGSFLLEAPQTPVRQMLFYIFISIFTMISYVSIFHMLSMFLTKKSISAVVCMLVFLGLFILALSIEAKLEAPEFISGFGMTANGIEQLPPEPNPRYLQPAARKVYQFFLDVIPTGQSIQLSGFFVVHPFLLIVYSTAISVITTVLGVFGFQKKDLK